MALFVEYNHRMIISFTPKEKYWWITGFNPYYQSPNIKMLKVTVRVRFDNPTMFMAFTLNIIETHTGNLFLSGTQECWSFNGERYK